MNFEEKFDYMVAEIERLIDRYDKYGYLKANEIIDILRKQEGKSARDLNVIFEYISGKSLNRYVKDRKMMATYNMMLKDDEYDINAYISCSGYDNESSFSTAFSEKFGNPPKKAYQEKDDTKLEEPISIKAILSTQGLSGISSGTTETIFGLPKGVIDTYNEICEYQALFGLEEKYVELAIYLHKEKGIDLQDAFKTVDLFVMDYKDDIFYFHSLNEILDYINEEVPAVYIKHLFSDVCLPELNEWGLYMKDEGGDILQETPEFVRAFFNDESAGISYNYLKLLYNDYLERFTDECDDFSEFLQRYNFLDDYDEFYDY